MTSDLGCCSIWLQGQQALLPGSRREILVDAGLSGRENLNLLAGIDRGQ